ncbi:histidine phosphatase family protein [Massilia sp. 9096]|uniref:histidine phosphatase family protein n=1 Tax=Massilia sp. 9096 TaxID=1500894 RepID=UPI00055E65FA|nr:histidine phosphatase family protein [Massilia sp. 9096]
MKLHLVRHPRPLVGPGLCYGASDVPVADDELARACACLRGAALFDGAHDDLPVYASPLRRCADLAQALRPRRLRLDARLMEMDFGRWELQPWSTIARDEVDAWAADLLHYRPGGAENVLDVARRVAAFLDELRHSGAAQALLVCHAGTIRLLTQITRLTAGATLEQAALQAAQTPHQIEYGALLTLEV